MKTTQTEFLKAAFRSGLLLTTLLVVVSGVSLAEPSRGGLTAQAEARIAADALLNKASPQTTIAVQPEDIERYRRALADTLETEQSEVVQDLIAVVPDPDATNYRKLHGDDLAWEDNPEPADHPRVLVAAVMSRETFDKYYRSFIGQDYQLQVGLWVTVVPELSNHFIGKSCPPTSQRLVEVIGLNPALEYSAIVEMWVDPRYLFRPAPDPEISDHAAELAYRVADPATWSFPSDRNHFLTFDPKALFLNNAWTPQAVTFRDWYTVLAKTQYRMEGDISTWGFPWTRLGYTYDWGNPDNHVGLSEFILRIDPVLIHAPVRIERGFTADDTEQWAQYFRCGPAAPRLTVNTLFRRLRLAWSRSPGATGYTVLYSPTEQGKPFAPPFTHRIEVGNRHALAVTLPPGSAYFVAVQSHNAQGRGGLSNIEYVHAAPGPFIPWGPLDQPGPRPGEHGPDWPGDLLGSFNEPLPDGQE